MPSSDVSAVKHAGTGVPIEDLLARRYSPYGWLDRSVDGADLRALFEAARWAPSCFNEQPWRYIVATRDDADTFDRVLGCLVEGNQAWARNVPVLGLGVVATTFARNGRENDHARHDLGLASANLTLEATARGLAVHQMAGIVPEKARQTFSIPAGYEAVTGIAIGYADPASDNERDRAPRERRPLAETVFGGDWGASAAIVRD